jgi:uncharacterized protein
MAAAPERPWISIAPDRLSARLRVPAGCRLDLAAVRQLLATAGLRQGIDGDALRSALTASSTERDILLASGLPPQDLIAMVITPVVALAAKVTQGQVIATSSHRGTIDGIGVDGRAIPVLLPAAIGLGLQLNENGEVTARRDGVVRQGSDGGFKIAIDGLVEVAVETPAIQVDEKGLASWVDLLPNHYITKKVMYRVLCEQRITCGLRGEVFEEASLSVVQPRRIHLAKGIAPLPGVDGKLEMLIDEGVHLKVDEQGRVDWHDHGRVEDVAKGLPLARILPPTGGIPGIDVRGKCLEPKAGRVLDPVRVIGEGAELHPQQPDLIQTASAGHFHRDRQKRICVQSRLIVEGDVDNKHGNIDTELSVLVKGDVKAGFAIKSAGDIEIMGVIEDARISALGNLLVRGGILQGTNRVKAQGDIDVRYVTNREIKCRNLRVNSSLRWTRVLATGEVMAKEVLAGDIIAAGNVTVDQLGNEDAIPTRVQVGTNPFEERQFIVAKEEHARLSEAVTQNKEHCKVIAHRLSRDPSLGDELRTALEVFSASCASLAACEVTLARHVERQQTGAQKPVTAMVKVGGVAYRGTELVFDEAFRIVLDKDLARPCFHIVEGAIVW